MTSVTIVRRIEARPSIVFEALTTPAGIAQWWGPDAGPVLEADVDLRVGGSFRVRFRMLDGSRTRESAATYLVVDPPARLASTWRWLGNEAEGESRIEFALRPVDGATELTFTHALLANDDEARDHEDGWNGAFDKLQRAIRRAGSARMTSEPLEFEDRTSRLASSLR